MKRLRRLAVIDFTAVAIHVTGAPLAEALADALLNHSPHNLNGDYRAAREQFEEIVALAQAVDTARERGPMGREEMDRVAPIQAIDMEKVK